MGGSARKLIDTDLSPLGQILAEKLKEKKRAKRQRERDKGKRQPRRIAAWSGSKRLIEYPPPNLVPRVPPKH